MKEITIKRLSNTSDGCRAKLLTVTDRGYSGYSCFGETEAQALANLAERKDITGIPVRYEESHLVPIGENSWSRI